MSANVERLGDLRVVECDGRIVRSQAAFALRDTVTAQSDARLIVLDLSEVNALEGGGLGMLMFLQRWAENHHIHLMLFNPRSSVRARLEQASSPIPFQICESRKTSGTASRGRQGCYCCLTWTGPCDNISKTCSRSSRCLRLN
jgi:anti-anti-sigma regulatory factor